MPGPVDTRGLQLWVNLKKEFKMVKPNYQEKNPEDVPSTKQNGVFVKGKQSAAVSCSANMAWLAGTGLGSGTKGKLGSAWVSALVGAWHGAWMPGCWGFINDVLYYLGLWGGGLVTICV